RRLNTAWDGARHEVRLGPRAAARAVGCTGRAVVIAFDEMKGSDGSLRPAYGELFRWLSDVRPDVLDYRRREAEVLFRRIGITFAVYGEADAQERLIPFDVLPRILASTEWDVLRAGLEQRVKAINHYIRDVYTRREILKAGVVPEELVFQNRVFRPEMNGQKVPHDIYVHIAGIDIVGVDLVEGRDLFVKDDLVFMRTTQGPKRVDVIYRRIDDDFLDPLAFRPDSVLGVPGLMSVYQAGNVTLANAVGTGVADDKAVYSYMPAIVKFYLGEEPILKNVPTWRCRESEHLAYVLDHLDELVVKEVHGSGGYGMLIGPAADKATIAGFRVKLKSNPKNFVAQPTLALSTCPTCVDEGVAPRHVDLRPFVLTGRDRVRIVPGGLTRVALK